MLHGYMLHWTDIYCKYKKPRNELTAIMLMTELAYIVKRAIGPRVKEVIYVSDSMIALSWSFFNEWFVLIERIEN